MPALNNDPDTTYRYGRLSYNFSGNHIAGSDKSNFYQSAKDVLGNRIALRKWSQNTAAQAFRGGYCDLNHIVVPVPGRARRH